MVQAEPTPWLLLSQYQLLNKALLVQKTDVKKKFGSSVKTWRKRLGISQEELAERADLHRTYVSDVERGARNLSLESITRVAHALNITVAELFPPEPAVARAVPVRGGGLGNGLVDILLVEDNTDDVGLTMHAFKQSRVANRVSVAADGQEALDYLFCEGEYAGRTPDDQPRIVLLDLHLPKVNGLEVLRRLKADERTQAIPVVILTVSQAFSDFTECQRLGAETYIVKPLNFHRLSQITPRLNLDWALFKPAAPAQPVFRV
jgi:CheY-like chemotaxis protein/DNA-binding XRE family transcriptional regulator